MGDFAGVTIKSVGRGGVLASLRVLHLERKKMKRKEEEEKKIESRSEAS